MYQGRPARRPSGASLQEASSQEPCINKRLFFDGFLFTPTPKKKGKLQLNLLSLISILKRIHDHIRVHANGMIIIILQVNCTSRTSDVR